MRLLLFLVLFSVACLTGCLDTLGVTRYSNAPRYAANNPTYQLDVNFGEPPNRAVRLAYFTMRVDTVGDTQEFFSKAQRCGNAIGANQVYWYGAIMGGDRVGIMVWDELATRSH